MHRIFLGLAADLETKSSSPARSTGESAQRLWKRPIGEADITKTRSMARDGGVEALSRRAELKHDATGPNAALLVIANRGPSPSCCRERLMR
jgi:hypothetical protein